MVADSIVAIGNGTCHVGRVPRAIAEALPGAAPRSRGSGDRPKRDHQPIAAEGLGPVRAPAGGEVQASWCARERAARSRRLAGSSRALSPSSQQLPESRQPIFRQPARSSRVTRLVRRRCLRHLHGDGLGGAALLGLVVEVDLGSTVAGGDGHGGLQAILEGLRAGGDQCGQVQDQCWSGIARDRRWIPGNRGADPGSP